MANYCKNTPIRLADGREVIKTHVAADEVGVTVSHFPTLAKREGLTRFAKRNEKGAPSFFWLVTEIEDLKARRSGIEVDLPFDEVVPLPYDNEKA